MNAIQILTAKEVRQVLKSLKAKLKKRYSVQRHQNLIIFRLSCCCGLRVSEIVGVRMCDVDVGDESPSITVRTKKKKEGQPVYREVPLNWDPGTLADLKEWRKFRAEKQCAPYGSAFIINQKGFVPISEGGHQMPMKTSNVRKRWFSALECLDPARVRKLSIHKGRHTFCSHSLAAGRHLVEIMNAAGHARLDSTSIYLHVVANPDARPVFPEKE